MVSASCTSPPVAASTTLATTPVDFVYSSTGKSKVFRCRSLSEESQSLLSTVSFRCACFLNTTTRERFERATMVGKKSGKALLRDEGRCSCS